MIAIIGPTASGKTALALEVAERYSGEIICADSRTIYTGMDVGTAKPTAEEQARVRHWGLDLVHPGESFSVAEFKTYADAAVRDIESRGKLALLVGGTGLYVDAVLYNFSFGPAPDRERRAELEAWSIERLYEYCLEHNIALPENAANKRHLIHAIERKDTGSMGRSPLRASDSIVGIATSMSTLRTRISDRAEHMFSDDVEKEATMLGKKYGWNTEAMKGNIYPLVKSYLDGACTLQEVKDKFATSDYQLAKRQMTWFRRNPDIEWVSLPEARSYIDTLLAAE